jgi:hypothetical protein
LTALFADLVSLIEDKQKANKQGSQLSKTELYVLNYFDGYFVISNVAKLTDPLYNVINALVPSYLSAAVDNLNNGRVDEVKYVRPESLQLLKIIIDHINKTRVDKLIVYDKTTEPPEIYYDTMIIVKGKVVWVSGETDATVRYKNVPVFVWEDKNLDNLCDTAEEQGEILVAIKGNAEKFKETILVAPVAFCGILTSARVWRAGARVFDEGSSCICLSATINAFSEISKEDEEGNAQYEVSQEGLIKVTNMLVDSIKRMMALCNQIDRTIEKLCNLPSSCTNENKQSSNLRDGEKHGDDSGDGEESDSKQIMLNQEGEMTSSSKQIRDGGKSSTSKMTGKSLRKDIQEIPANPLTFENLARHDLIMQRLPDTTSCRNASNNYSKL